MQYRLETKRRQV